MKKILIVITICLTGCYTEGKKVTIATETVSEGALIFTSPEGSKVYRIKDGHIWLYMAVTANGSPVSICR